MPSVTITITDTPTGGIALQTSFHPAIGNPCTQAQAASLDIIRQLRKEYGITGVQYSPEAVAFRVGGVDIDAIHRTRDNVAKVAQ